MIHRASHFKDALCCYLLAAVLIAATRPSVSTRSRFGPPKLKPVDQVHVSQAYGKLPLSFEANQGQVDSQVKFFARGSGYTLFLTSTDMVLSLPAVSTAPDLPKRSSIKAPREFQDPLERFRAVLPKTSDPVRIVAEPDVVRIRLEGANHDANVVGLDELSEKVNYFIGNDLRKWRRDIPTYAKVKYRNVYPGIDLVHYGNQGQLEHDFIVAPGADPDSICLSIQASDRIEVDAQGSLLLNRIGGPILLKPRIYQQRDGVRTEIAGGFALKDGNRVGFKIHGYDTSLPLILDPAIIYSTYLGGKGWDDIYGVSLDSSGNVYITGQTGSTDFPAINPIQIKRSMYRSAFVAKLNASGTALLYSTYLGGNMDQAGWGIAVDPSGNAYVTGWTNSRDFPTANPFQRSLRGWGDAFVTKLSSSGNALVYSTYLGGSQDFQGEEGRSIAVDSSGCAYVTGRADSTDFPTRNAIQASSPGWPDAFVAKLNSSGNELVYSTYLGGTSYEHGRGIDEGHSIAVDPSGNAYVTGYTESNNFPTLNPIQANCNGSGDAFVTKLSPFGMLSYSTCLGGIGYDEGDGIAVDSSGNAYVSGYTESTDFPTANAFEASCGCSGDAFVTKLSPLGNALEYSTYLGGGKKDRGSAVAVDSSGCAYVTGYTISTDFPLANPIQAEYGGGRYDAFVAELNPSGNALAFCTYLGGKYDDAGDSIALDSSGNVYVAGETFSPDFPTASPLQANLHVDGFVTKIHVSGAAVEFPLPEGGACATSTAGTETSTLVGYAAATVASGTDPYAVAVFSFRQNGIVVSEAAVPASPPTTSARIYVDYRSGVPAMPGSVNAGWVDINTGLAIVNRGAATANVTYTLRNKTGMTLAIGHGNLASGAHFAKFVNQLKDVAPDFSIPSDFPTVTRFGSLDVASDQPLAVLTLRLTMNQRKEALLTSTPIANLTKPLGRLPLYLPQFVDGGGYLTTLILLNTSNAVETGRLVLFGDNGAPLVVNQLGGTRDSTFSYSIQPSGVFVFETDGSPAEANAGSVQLIPDVNTSSPVGAGVYSFLQGGIRVTESGVPSASPTTHARIYIDQSGSHGTGLAIASPGTSGVNVTLKAFQTDGSTPEGTSGGVTLNGNGHTARFVSQLISGLPEGFTGVLDISSSSPFVALTLRSLINSRRDFLLTTFPIADVTRPAPTPIVFPQIADGGGYVTEFILLSPGGASSTTLSFYSEDGTPLAVGK